MSNFRARSGTSPEGQQALLKARCRLAGVVLVLFDVDVNKPAFEVTLMTVSSPTDMFHTKKFVQALHRHDREKLTCLFG